MKKYSVLLFVLAGVFLAGITYFIVGTQSKNTKQDSKQEIPASTASDKYVSRSQGYSLYLPNNYKVSSTTPNTTNFFYPNTHPDNGLAWIDSEPANGRTVEQVVQNVIADQGGILDIKSKDITLDGEHAVVLSPLTGQNLIRRLVVIHDNTLYQMNFTPEASQPSEPFNLMEDFYKSVIDTFRFNE